MQKLKRAWRRARDVVYTQYDISFLLANSFHFIPVSVSEQITLQSGLQLSIKGSVIMQVLSGTAGQ